MKKYQLDVFDLIAPIYNLFYHYQVRHYYKIFAEAADELNLGSYRSVIDIGCGTGAMCKVLKDMGLEVTGSDRARKILSLAEKRPANKGIRFVQADIMKRTVFDDGQFDISIASLVAHGLKPEERKVMYAEMSRISKQLVILYDYNEKRSLLTTIIEWLERGDYFNFIKVVQDELK
jgi:ubiquinone/menaquinone biosynthesis C-methylase UbiE